MVNAERKIYKIRYLPYQWWVLIVKVVVAVNHLVIHVILEP